LLLQGSAALARATCANRRIKTLCLYAKIFTDYISTINLPQPPYYHRVMLSRRLGELRSLLTTCAGYTNYYIYASCHHPSAHFIGISVGASHKGRRLRAPYERYIVVSKHCYFCSGLSSRRILWYMPPKSAPAETLRGSRN
jgi:hypothetical protein